MKLKIGRIPYANLFPIFYILERECDCSLYEFVEGVPSRLNRMLREGEIDISPSSSIEYLKNPQHYKIIDGHSISSRGPVKSILLFTRYPIEQLTNIVIEATSQSETSVALLQVILSKFYGIKCRINISESPEESGNSAFLLIGDDALRYGSKLSDSSWLIYDLGEMWYRQTNLPFVFALWIARNNIDSSLMNRFINDLNNAKEIALKNFREIARHSPAKAFLSEDELAAYWGMIDYDFVDEHKKGLEIFDRYLKEIGYFKRGEGFDDIHTS